MKSEKEVRRMYEKYKRLYHADQLSEEEQRQMMTLEWVLHDE